MPILSGSELASALGVTLTDAITGIAAGVSASVVGYLWWDPSASANRTEFYDSRGGQLLALNHGPVVSITSVNEINNAWWGWGSSNGGAYAEGTDPFDASTLLTYGTDYAWRVDAGSTGPVLVRLNAQWPFGLLRPIARLAANVTDAYGCVKVVYQTDESGILAIAKDAAIDEGIMRYRLRPYGFGFVTSDGMDGANVTVAQYQRPPGTKPSRGGLINPAAVVKLEPYYRRAL